MKISPLPYRTRGKRLIFPYGKFHDLFVTGFEAKHILNAGDVKVRYGYVYEGRSNNDLKDYVDYYYGLKSRETNPAKRLRFKLLLNACYGKFCQLTEIKESNCLEIDLEQGVLEPEKVYETGGLFNPVIGSWITGHARARLYEFMKLVEDSVLYCDTDSIAVIDADLPTGNELGDLVLEKEGIATFIREKLYVIRDFSNDILKAGKHGFHGKDEDLLKTIQEATGKYKTERMLKLREAIIQRKTPFKFYTLDRSISLSSSQKREPIHLKSFMKEGKYNDAVKLR